MRKSRALRCWVDRVAKTLREELLGTPELERMFLEEARLQARLSHRNLVQAHDLGVTEGRPWVRLDFVDGVEGSGALTGGRREAEVPCGGRSMTESSAVWATGCCGL